MRRILPFVFLLAAFSAASWFAAETPTHIVIMHTNDLHGQLLPRDGVGGIAEIATIIRSGNPDLILDAGDISTGTFLADEFKGAPTIQAMNKIGYDAGTIGNHEFDYGQDALRLRLREAKFPVLSANLQTPVSNTLTSGTLTTGTIQPGVIWVGNTFQFAIEALIPVNRQSGTNVGVIAQLHFYLDDIDPRGIGKPIFGGPVQPASPFPR